MVRGEERRGEENERRGRKQYAKRYLTGEMSKVRSCCSRGRVAEKMGSEDREGQVNDDNSFNFC